MKCSKLSVSHISNHHPYGGLGLVVGSSSSDALGLHQQMYFVNNIINVEVD